MGTFNIKKALLAAQPTDPTIVSTLDRSTEPVTIPIGWRRLRPWCIRLGFDAATRLHTLAIHTYPKKAASITLVFDPRTNRVGLLPKGYDPTRQLDVARMAQSTVWVDDGRAAFALLQQRYHKLSGHSPASLVCAMLEHMGTQATAGPIAMAASA